MKYSFESRKATQDFIPLNIDAWRTFVFFVFFFFKNFCLFVWNRHSKFMGVKLFIVTKAYNCSTWEAETG